MEVRGSRRHTGVGKDVQWRLELTGGNWDGDQFILVEIGWTLEVGMDWKKLGVYRWVQCGAIEDGAH